MKHAMNVFTNDQLVTDINAVLADAEALLSATADQGGEQIALVRAKAESSLRLARRRMVEAADRHAGKHPGGGQADRYLCA
jgi:ElaB/YqjD/DUF883 family membrane-anchored ribosome-binding protein